MTSKRIIVTTENIERTFDADRWTYDGQGWLEVRKGADDPVIVAVFAAGEWESVHFADCEIPAPPENAVAQLSEINATLREHGFHYPLGARGVDDLAEQRAGMLDELRRLDPENWPTPKDGE